MKTTPPPPPTAIELARAAARRQAGAVKPTSSATAALSFAMRLARGERPAASADTKSLYEHLLSTEGLTALDTLRDADEALQSAMKLSDLKKRSVLADLARAADAATPATAQARPQGSFARHTLVRARTADIDITTVIEPLASAKTLGAMVRRAREEKGVSQIKLAELAGVGRRFVSELENGKSSLEFNKVLQVAAAAGVAVMARAPS